MTTKKPDPVDELVASMRRADIVQRYRWQFRSGREIDACVPDMWLPAIAKLCAGIEEAVPAIERTGFYWLDLKEKRGQLAVDFVFPHGCGPAIEALVDHAIEQAAAAAP